MSPQVGVSYNYSLQGGNLGFGWYLVKFVAMIAFAAALFLIGSWCFFSPRSIQSLALKVIETGVTARSAALRAYVQSGAYVVSVRLIGLLGYGMSAVIIYAIYRGSK